MFRRLLTGVALVALTVSARSADVDPLLPAETENVMFVNVRQLLDSQMSKKFAIGPAKQALKQEKVAQIVEDLGLDPLKDLDKVTVASWGTGEDTKALIVVRGTFNPEKLFNTAVKTSQAEGDKVAIVEEGRYKLIQITPGNNADKPFFVTVADEKTIIGGSDKKLVTTALGIAEKGGGKPAVKRELQALLLLQDEKASMYSCGLVEGKLDNVPGLGNIPGANAEKLAAGLASMKTYGVTVKVADEISVEASMGMKDISTAEDFEAEIFNVFGTVKNLLLPLLAANQPKLKLLSDDLAKTLKSKVKGKDVIISVKLTANALAEATARDEQ